MKTTLRMTGQQLLQLLNHLYPGDGNEAVAVALCGRRAGSENHVLMIQQIYMVPYEHCPIRNPVRVEWSTDILLPVVAKAAKENLALVKFHSHPTGSRNFSDLDNVSDRELMESVYGWTNTDQPHASVIMLPTGEMFGRTISIDGQFAPIDLITVVGDDLRFWYRDIAIQAPDPISLRTEQAFGKGTTNLLKRLSIAVVGCSGTGSLVIEQLARLQVGRLVLIDPDHIELKNLTRITNSFSLDAKEERFKVDVLARAINDMGLGVTALPIAKNLLEPDVIKLVAECDILFGCMDGVEGRHYLNLISSFYSLPYFDLGVRLDSDGQGGVTQVCGTVHYLQPGGSSLLTRQVYTLEQLRAEGLKRTSPEIYNEQRKFKYIQGVNEDRPAVISVNMLIASLAVNELLARLHSFRTQDNSGFAAVRVSLSDSFLFYERDGDPDFSLAKNAGRGDIIPLLNRSELSQEGQ